MSDVRWTHKPALRRPVLVSAHRGWNDAGDAASAALEFIGARFDPAEVARIDCEEFFDFTATRPTVRLRDGLTREIEWPDTVITAAEIPGADQDLVLLTGPEPALRWRRYSDAVLDVCRELDVSTIVTLGSLLADVPHSRPVNITGIASDAGLVDRLGFTQTNYEGPTGITATVHHAAAQAGVKSVSLWASVPHYVAATPNPKVALALVRAFEGAAGVVVDAGDLEEAAEDYDRQVSAAVAGDPEVRAFVERLESAMDDLADDEEQLENLPSADAIAKDFQKYLRQQRPE